MNTIRQKRGWPKFSRQSPSRPNSVHKSGVIQSLFFPEDGSQAQVLAADVLSPDVSTRDVVVESRVNADGNTEVKVKGWFKVDHLPGPDDPPMPLLTFSGFPSTPLIGIGGQSP